MNRNRTILAGIVLALSLVLAACGGQPVAAQPAAGAAPAQPAATQPAQPVKPVDSARNLTRTNQGGAVTFEVTPLNLGSSAATLDFEVAMNTHSVDLSFDLKQLAMLKTDTGAEITPSAYQRGSGHHVTSKLSFPADKLAGAKTLTLIVKDVAGVPERTFTWDLP